jgi:hypothetical protein
MASRVIPGLPCLRNIPFVPPQQHVSHWVNLCTGGMIPLLEVFLSTGGSVGLLTCCEIDDTIRGVLSHMLEVLSKRYKGHLPSSAIHHWSIRLPQDIHFIRPCHRDSILPVSFLEAGACHAPFLAHPFH